MNKTVLSPALQPALDFFQEHQPRFLSQLAELVAVPSVSFSGFDQKEVGRCGAELQKLFVKAGLENVREIPGAHPDRPYIYGEWLKAPGKPTLLLYGHYDVQPPGNAEKWKSPPFTLTERDGRLYARGSADDKGGVLANLAAIESI